MLPRNIILCTDPDKISNQELVTRRWAELVCGLFCAVGFMLAGAFAEFKTCAYGGALQRWFFAVGIIKLVISFLDAFIVGDEGSETELTAGVRSCYVRPGSDEYYSQYRQIVRGYVFVDFVLGFVGVVLIVGFFLGNQQLCIGENLMALSTAVAFVVLTIFRVVRCAHSILLLFQYLRKWCCCCYTKAAAVVEPESTYLLEEYDANSVV